MKLTPEVIKRFPTSRALYLGFFGRADSECAMPRYYCDYCDTYLTHDSPSVRKQHNAGYKHKANVRAYYQQFEEQQTQSIIDQKVKEHQHMAAFQGFKPMVPVLPRPGMPLPGSSPAPMMQPMRPVMAPNAGYPPAGYRPPVAQVPGNAPPGQGNGVYRPPMTPPGGQRPPGSTASNGPANYPPPGNYGGNYGYGQPPRSGMPPGYAPYAQPASGDGDSPVNYRG